MDPATGLVVVLVLAFLIWRVAKLGRRVEQLASEQPQPDTEPLVRDLLVRVARLEEALLDPTREPLAPAQSTVGTKPPVSIWIDPAVAEALRRGPHLPPAPVVAAEGVAVERTEEPEVTPLGPARPSFLARLGERLRAELRGDEWEAVVGGSWANKVGVLVLVIGISLFLGYSLTSLGHAGRVAVGISVGVAMLAGGVVLERRARYVIFARGLIGGGWAALYFTTYAAHGLEAARVIDNPLSGMLLLVAVAAGLICHSLTYRREVVTGLAYGVGFITLILSPLSGFALAASLPLVGSIVLVAQRFGWVPLAVGGLIATYAAYALRFGPGLSPGTALDHLTGQSVLAAYWLLFEGFDLLGLRRNTRPELARTVLPLNACGFLGVSLLHWPTVQAETLYVLIAGSGVAYLASALIRARLRPPPTGVAAEADALAGALSGGYEAPITLAAALGIAAIAMRFSGLRVNLGLLLEAELLFLAGLRLGQPYLRALGAVVFVVSLAKLALVDLTSAGHLTVAGRSLMAVTPLALLSAAVFYVNRALASASRAGPRLRAAETAYSYAGSALLALVLGCELPREYVGAGWLVLAAPLFELGLRRSLEELRVQAYGIATLGLAAFLVVNELGLGATLDRYVWVPLVPGVLLTYGAAVRLFRLTPGGLPVTEQRTARDAGSAAGTVLLATLLWHVLPAPVVAVAWGVLGLLLIELGFSRRLPALRLQGHLVVAAAFGRLFLANFTNLGETVGVSHRILTVLPFVVLLYYLSARLRDGEAATLAVWEARLPRLYLYAPAVLAVFLVRFEAGRAMAVIGWALLGLGLLWWGVRADERDLRWQSYAVALLTFGRSWATNFYIPESLAGPLGRIGTGAVVIASFYAGQFLSPRSPAVPASISRNRIVRGLVQLDLHARAVYSILGAALLAVLLSYEVSGRLLTMAWGIEGALLLAVGLPLRERVLRLSGFLLLAVCTLKLFAYDFRELDTPARILSFVGLGLVLLGVSFVYARFGAQLRRYL